MPATRHLPIACFHLVPEIERAFAYAQATSVDGILHLAGTLSLDDAFVPVAPGDMTGQLKQIYARIGRTLAAHNAGFEDVLKETLFVTDMDAMLAANDVRRDIYGLHLPACTVVEVRRLAFPDCLAEIEVVARLRTDTRESRR